MDNTKDFKSQILNRSIAKRAFFRVFVLASTISLVSLLRVLSPFGLGSLAPTNNHDCVADSISDSTNATLTPGSYLFQSRFLNNFWGTFDSMNCKQDLNLTVNVVTELMGKQFLDCGAKSLCIGEASPMAVMAMQQLGFTAVTGVSLKHKNNIVHHLHFQDSSFDFVFSRDVDKVPVPALLVLEVERILKPGGIGAILVGTSASPVSSLLRSSSVVHLASVTDLNLVVFKKRSENSSTSSFSYQYALPADCPSVSFTKPLIEMMEPLVEERPRGYEKRMLYLPKFVDVSSRKRLVYIDIGVGELLLKANVTDSFFPSYPIRQSAFSVYYVHYNISILSSYVKRPGITFVYHPGLDGKEKDTDLNPFVGKEEFDFLVWFKETVKHADFVVLKMNVGKVGLKFLSDIFESGAICLVDELFLGCPDSDTRGGKGMKKKKKKKESCMNMYKGLRSNGVYVHQWWEM